MIVLGPQFYLSPATEAARLICGKILCVRQKDGTVLRGRITETECYYGQEDTACHAHHGRTARTAVMYSQGGVAYVYLCYGMHNMLNKVTGPEGHPEAVLIRGIEGFNGPGRVTKAMGIDCSFNGKSFMDSEIWLEDDGCTPELKTTPRIGIQYASDEDQKRLWRFIIFSSH